jgi:hypothetical protein
MTCGGCTLDRHPAPRQVTISDGGVLPNVLVPKDGGESARPAKASKPKSKPAASSAAGDKAAAPVGGGDAELVGDEGEDFSDGEGEGEGGTGGEGDDSADAPA